MLACKQIRPAIIRRFQNKCFQNWGLPLGTEWTLDVLCRCVRYTFRLVFATLSSYAADVFLMLLLCLLDPNMI